MEKREEGGHSGGEEGCGVTKGVVINTYYKGISTKFPQKVRGRGDELAVEWGRGEEGGEYKSTFMTT